MIKINNWRIVNIIPNLYIAPELITVHLIGDAIAHPKLGSRTIKTSAIVDAKKRIVYTKSGSEYKLGWINPEYRRWIKKNYGEWDWRNPIKVKEL